METIKKIYPFNENILITDFENKLWVMGENKYRRTGFSDKDEPVYTPVYTGIIIDADEEVKKYYVYGKLMSIYTSKGRLYISRISSKNKQNMRENGNNQVLNLGGSQHGRITSRRASPIPSGRLSSRRGSPQASPIQNRVGRNTRSSTDNQTGSNDYFNIDDEIYLDFDPPNAENNINTPTVLSSLSDLEKKINSSTTNNNNEDIYDQSDIENNIEKSDDNYSNDNDDKEEDTDDETEDDVDTMEQSQVSRRRPREIFGILMPSSNIMLLSESTNRRDGGLRIIDDGSDDNSDDNSDDELSYDDDESNNGEDNSYFENIEYYNDICCKSIKQQGKEGIDLLEDDVEDVVCTAETIFFKKDGKVYFFNRNLTPKNVVFNNLGISAICVEKSHYIYYQLIFPFDYEKLVFKNNFIYLKSGSYHHIISAYGITVIGNTVCNLVWIYFKTEFDATDDDMYYIEVEGAVYVKKANSVYKYCHKLKDIKQFVDDDCKTFIIPTNDGFDNVLFCVKNDGVYFDHGYLKKEIQYDELLPYIIDMNSFMDSQLVIVDIDNTQRYTIKGSSLFFNIHGLSRYKLMNSGLVYYDSSSTLYYLTNVILNAHVYGTMEIEKINTKYETFYIYMFSNLPTPITNIEFTNNLIVIQSENKYYYHTIDTENFRVDKFTEITIKNNTSNVELVCKHYIVRNRKDFDNNVTLSISTTSNKLEKLMNIIEMLRGNTNFEINFMKGKDVVSYGDGPKREFMEAAVIDFSEKYFIRNNANCEFNIEEMKKFNEDELVVIGSMLHAVICHSNNHLPIRLPLPLVSAILKKKPTIIELEYFVKLEDPDALKSLQPYKDDVETIRTFGYDTYEDCLKSLCKFYHNVETNETIDKMCKLIAKGFRDYHDVKNISIMNMPTLDYFLSGDYLIDRDLLIKNLIICDATIDNKDKKSKYIDHVISTIKNLPEDKLAIFLKNWSGTSIVKKSYKYHIYIEKHCDNSDIHFATCSIDLTISENLLMNPDTFNLLIELLTTPVDFMIDP
ncbi:hypothetical protein QJ857_gp0930 [Tupanvirus soda lake]|uniref:HECT domain-containing protein n=2 Tax=Tupanvirus TaxID=2094720 RepID=A0A6N1NUN1_9VIRU|nr:hypothetical protein QJ857_gp0930 [Tupanvirus soda lake]QKU35123.1 hypothetical protein [Tupanvirus soda lake]